MRIPSRRTYLLLATIAAFIALFMAGRTFILGPIIKRALGDYATRELGFDAQVASIGGDLLTGLTLNGLTLQKPEPASPQILIRIHQTRVRYSLPTLLKGTDAFARSITFALQGVTINIDTRGEGKPAEEATRFADYFPDLLPELTANDVNVLVQGKESSITARHGTLSIKSPAAGAEQPVELAFPAFQYSGRFFSQQEIPLHLSLRYTSGRLSSEALTFGQRLLPLQGECQLDQKENRLLCNLTWQEGQELLSVRGAVGTDLVSCQFLARKFPLPQALLPALPPVAGTIDGDISLSLHPDKADETLDATIQLAVHNGSIGTLPAEGRLAGKIAAGRLHVDQSRITIGANSLALKQAVVPLKSLGLPPLALAAATEIGEVRIHLADIPGLQDLRASSPADPLMEKFPAHALDLTGSLRGRKIAVQQGEFRMARSAILLQDAKLQLPPAGNDWRDTTLEARLHVTVTDLTSLAKLFRLPALAGSATGTATLTGSLAAPQGRLQLSARSFSFRQCPAGKVELSVEADAKKLSIPAFHFAHAADRIRFAGVYDRKAKGWEKASAAIGVQDLARYADCLDLPASASGRLEAQLDKSAPGKSRLTLQIQQGRLGPVALTQLQLLLTETAPQQYTFSTQLDSAPVAARLTGQLQLDDHSGATVLLNELHLQANARALDLAGPARFTLDWNKKYLTVDQFILQGITESVALRGTLSEAGNSRLTMSVSDFATRNWLPESISKGTFCSGANLQLEVAGSLSAPRLSMDGKVARLVTPLLSEPLTGAFALHASSAGITIERFSWRDSAGSRLTAVGTLPYDLIHRKALASPLNLEAAVDLPRFRDPRNDNPDKPATGSLEASLTLHGTWQRPRGRLQANLRQVLLPFLPDPLGTTPLTARCEAQLVDKRLDLTAFRLEAPGFSLTANGAWSGFALPFVTPGKDDNQNLPGSIDIHGRLETADIGWLAAGHRGIRRLKGRVTGTFAAKGPADRPDLTGSMILTDGELRLRSQMPTLQSLAGRLEFDRQTIRLRAVEGRLGGAPFNVSGTVTRQATDYFIDVRLQGDNLLLFRDEFMKIRGDAAISLRGPWRRMALAGDIWLTDARYTKNVNFLGLFRGPARQRTGTGELFSFSDPPWRDMTYQLRIQGHQPFLLQNNVARAVFRPNLLLRGTGELPLLTGEIYVDPSTITVPAGRISVESGLIRLMEQDPARPMVTLSAKSKLSGYDITMLIQGTPDEPVVTLSSVPPLPEEELLLLVLTGKMPQSGRATRRQSTVGLNMALYLGKGLLAKWFAGESPESEESLLDRFELDIGRDITRSGDNTVEAQFLLADGVLLPADRLMLTSEKDIYDNFNAGLKIIFRFR